jgi:hypothetical protein
MAKPANTPPCLPNVGGASSGAGSSRERDDSYHKIAAKLTDDLRVIVCAKGLQYILQRRYSDGFRRVTWTAIGYFISRTSLLRACEGFQSLSARTSIVPLAALAERATDWTK